MNESIPFRLHRGKLQVVLRGHCESIVSGVGCNQAFARLVCCPERFDRDLLNGLQDCGQDVVSGERSPSVRGVATVRVAIAASGTKRLVRSATFSMRFDAVATRRGVKQDRI